MVDVCEDGDACCRTFRCLRTMVSIEKDLYEFRDIDTTFNCEMASMLANSEVADTWLVEGKMPHFLGHSKGVKSAPHSLRRSPRSRRVYHNLTTSSPDPDDSWVNITRVCLTIFPIAVSTMAGVSKLLNGSRFFDWICRFTAA